MIILKIEFAKNKCLSTIWSTEKIPVAWTYQDAGAREHKKNANFLWFYNLTPTWFLANFLLHIFDALLQTICYAAVPDIPLRRYKRNWPITCDLRES